MTQKFVRILAAVAVFATGAAAAAADQLRWGYDLAPFPPWNSRSPAGEWSGFDYDIMEALCTHMQADCEIVEIAWDGMIPALQANKIDIIWTGMSITPQREEVIDFSDRYRRGPAAYIAETEMDLPISVEGFQGKSVGIKKATNFYTYFEHYYGDAATVKLYDTTDDIIADLSSGRLDVAMGDILELQRFLDSPDGDMYEMKGVTPVDPLLGKGAGAGIRQGDTALQDRLNTALKEIRDNGEYDAIAKKYFNFDPYGSD
ncbi:MAG: transporter substrate-binding domain-containing protein [Rhodobacteraceae bacterium]|jgi:polar amino acid transport system substrate-binding protein|nr:transporter substrate-binding domain-containing protein [Paracoccaceae bacterium]